MHIRVPGSENAVATILFFYLTTYLQNTFRQQWRWAKLSSEQLQGLARWLVIRPQATLTRLST